jgi:hypothetical protein
MNRHTIASLLLALLLPSSAALAQVGSPQLVPNATESTPGAMPPPPSPGPSPSSETGVFQPPPQSTAPPPSPDVSAWPPAAQPVSPSTASYAPAAQPSVSPSPSYVIVPGPPAYQPVAPWMTEPSPSLGLVPGADNPHWDISVDALWLTRDTERGIPLGYAEGYTPHGYRTSETDSLWSDDVLFPLAPGVRFQLVSRITDRMTVEATCWGLQDWSIGRTIYGDPDGQTVLAHSSWLQTPDFDTSLGYTYSSQVANVEINQRFKFNSYDPYRALSWLWGVRYFHLSDDFTLSGSDWLTGDSESLNWQTKNNLIGMQLGLQGTWGSDRFQLCTEVKIGLFANIYSQHGVDSAVGTPGFEPFDVSHSGTDLSALFEVSILLRYRVTKCAWLRLGYQAYGVTGLALGPRQLDSYDTNGSLGLDGLSLGLEITR